MWVKHTLGPVPVFPLRRQAIWSEPKLSGAELLISLVPKIYGARCLPCGVEAVLIAAFGPIDHPPRARSEISVGLALTEKRISRRASIAPWAGNLAGRANRGCIDPLKCERNSHRPCQSISVLPSSIRSARVEPGVGRQSTDLGGTLIMAKTDWASGPIEIG